MGNIYKRKDTWYIDFRVNGRRIRQKAGKSKRLAELALNDVELKAERNQLGFLEQKKIQLEDFIKEFLNYSQAQNRPSTTKRYKSALDSFLTFIKSETTIRQLNELSANSIEKYKIWRKSVPIARNGSNPLKSRSGIITKGAKSYTVNFEIMTLKTALKFAVKWNYIEKSPADEVKQLKAEDVKPRRFLSEGECHHLLRSSSKELFPIFFTFLNTGMRKAELINLEWDDVDFQRGVIKIRRKTFWKPKTGEREIPINQELREILGTVPRKSNFVFINKEGNQINGDKLRRSLMRLAKRSGIENLTEIHAFRHTFASRLVANGVDVPTVKNLLGHQSIETTMIYTHQTNDQLRDAVSKLGFGSKENAGKIIKLG